MYATVLVALDGSPDALAGARLALTLARSLGCQLLCAHVYDAAIHTGRFREMEPGLPGRYQDPAYLGDLRRSHDGLITEGFHALSRGYLQAFREEAGAAGVTVREVILEGRNYVELCGAVADQRADLVVVGATGLGAQGDGLLGSTALRVLRAVRCDVLVARAGSPEGPVLAGVDGSPHAALAARRATGWARGLDAPLRPAAAYDPVFHRTIFRTMAGSLSAEQREAVGLERQEELHEELIDDGLGRLYQTFLDAETGRARAAGAAPDPVLLTGKAYRALVAAAGDEDARLVVVGRFGHNREASSDLGSQAEAVARLAPCSVLVTAPAPPEPGGEPQAAGLSWDEEALARLERVPAFARPMARAAVEDRVRADGAQRVTAEAFAAVARSFGMGGHGGGGGG